MRGRIKVDACRNNFGRAVIVVMMLFMGNMGRAMPAVGKGGGSGCRSSCQDNNTCVSANALKQMKKQYELLVKTTKTCIDTWGISKCKNEERTRNQAKESIRIKQLNKDAEIWVCQ